MGRSGYSDGCDGWELVRWRGAVDSALRGTRGQAFLREALAALDAMPAKELIRGDLVTREGCCLLGAVAQSRGLQTERVDVGDRDELAELFGIAPAMAAEIMFVNDDYDNYWKATPAQRFARVRAWVAEQIKGE